MLATTTSESLSASTISKGPETKPPPPQSRPPVQLTLDTGDERVRVRQGWWQLWLPRDPPSRPPTGVEDAKTTPLGNASFVSKLTYSWMTEIMVLGYRRTLQASDLWKPDLSRQAGTLSDKLDAAWTRRLEDAKTWNAQLDSGEIKPGLFKRVRWSIRGSAKREILEKKWRDVDARKQASLIGAINDIIGSFFWIGGASKVFADVGRLMLPLIVKSIINFSKDRETAMRNGTEPPDIGRGIGMAVGSFLIVLSISIAEQQYFWRSQMSGVLVRGALIGSLYKRGVNLTAQSRTTLTNSVLINHISTDVSRIDYCLQWFHSSWAAPIEIAICLIILCFLLGPSALAGFAIFFVVLPLIKITIGQQVRLRRGTVPWTDRRAKLLLEVLGGMRVIKYFTYESPFSKRLFNIRGIELNGVRKTQFSRSALVAIAAALPILAATLAFVTYTSTGHIFDAAIIFASLNLFQLLRLPMMVMPRALSANFDAKSAIVRLEKVFNAEILTDTPIVIDVDQEHSLDVEDATFAWERQSSDSESKEKDPEKEKVGNKERAPFQIKDITLKISHGQLVAIVGPVGSGKSSLLQGIIGEMRKVSGKVSFGGRVAYCPQSAWIQNATLRDNVLFGQEFDEVRYWQAVKDSSLLADLLALPDGDTTEIGEKGITLSGGQKQRVSIARALYYDADIVIFDDPLSAVDAHVGTALFRDAIQTSLRSRGKTVILVTHALHFLSQCDYIYTLSEGRIVESGTYQQLIINGAEFARLDKAFGGSAEQHLPNELSVSEETASTIDQSGAGTGKLAGQVIVKETRSTGSVSGRVYWKYFIAARGYWTWPLLLLMIILVQGSQIMAAYTLIWWQSNTLQRPNWVYQLLYACMGLGQAFFTLFQGFTIDIFSSFVSRNIHAAVINKIFLAPMSYYDTTPAGRIMNVLGKDMDVIDDQLPITMKFFVLTLSSCIASLIMIINFEHFFVIVGVIVVLAYYNLSRFYSESAREFKRLDALFRSLLYGHFSESLTGLPTIRSYGKIHQFIRNNQYHIDLENRALLLSATNQRWLALRLDFLGAILVLTISLFAVFGVSGITPSQTGLVLTYTNVLLQLGVLATRQFADVENDINAVERVSKYSDIQQEAAHEIPENKPVASWPAEGRIDFQNIVLRYRPGLPSVLDNVSMSIRGGEKIGVVGRTGAGKSSLFLALLRIVELESGSITIDGVDVSKIGLRDLRSKISIIPQDPLLFSGTIRSNLDPFNLYNDAQLWDALRRSYLTDDSSLNAETAANHNRFTLETPIEAEGSNLSLGERSLLSLARALVKDSKIVVLDEATASVDLETDSKIQRTIRTQFKDHTLLCIAHRLRTVLSYDRILVLDHGKVAEFDTPLKLFQSKGGIFSSMCEGSGISLEDFLSSEEGI